MTHGTGTLFTLSALLVLPACPTEIVGKTTGAETDSGADDSAGDDTDEGELPLGPAELELGYSQVKQFDFTWNADPHATHYQLLERASENQLFALIRDEIVSESISITVPLHLRHDASYKLMTCAEDYGGCVEYGSVDVSGDLAPAIGFFKASSPSMGARFGWSVAVSQDDRTLVAGAPRRHVGETYRAGTVYVFVRAADDTWDEEAILVADQPRADAEFGWSVAVSADGDTIAVGTQLENHVHVFSRGQTGWSTIAQLQGQNTHDWFGAVVELSAGGERLAVVAPGEEATYVFSRAPDDSYVEDAHLMTPDMYYHKNLALSADGETLAVGTLRGLHVFTRGATTWDLYEVIGNIDVGEDSVFGWSVALSANGDTLAVGDPLASPFQPYSGLAYVYARGVLGWEPQAEIHALNANEEDQFGYDVDLSDDGALLAVGAWHEDGDTDGIGGDPSNNLGEDVGAIYLYERSAGSWGHREYVKPKTSHGKDTYFGSSFDLSGSTRTIAVGTYCESSDTAGIGGDPKNADLNESGALFLY